MSTIIFLSGFALPSFISKSNWFFNKSFWSDHEAIFYKSKTPTSDAMIEHEIYNLIDLINNHPGSHIVGHSLGAWWAANVACNAQAKMNKMVLWTPLGIAGVIPIFKCSHRYEAFNLMPHPNFIGPNKAMVVYAKNDLIVPYKAHALPLIEKFKAETISLDGGHAWQSDHRQGLTLMKKWLGLNR